MASRRNARPAPTAGTFLPRVLPRTIVPPIKCQGIKTRLVGFIAESIRWDGNGRWIEPFLGSGVVLFNLCPQRALAADTNRHLVRLYCDIQSGAIDERIVRAHLEAAGMELARLGEDYYYRVREDFNVSGNPLDLLFLNRSCFNGVMRFNQQGRFNVPFCRKPDRFRRANITKICNQVKAIREILAGRDWVFRVADWQATLAEARPEDFVYCDPPYIGRHSDYFNRWTSEDAARLAETVQGLRCGHAVSMWLENRYRRNPHVAAHWAGSTVRTFSHFYHVGSAESLRHPMTEALLLAPAFAADRPS
jgi:DNA adenine methylase